MQTMVSLRARVFERRGLSDGSVGMKSLTHTLASFSLLKDVQMVKGFANVFAGGEGLFMTTLTGQEGGSTVWLQGQPPQRMISEIARRVPGGGLGLAVPLGVGGGGGGGEGGDGEGEGEQGQ